MTKKNIISIGVIVIAGLILAWINGLNTSVATNTVTIAETRQELHSELNGISKTLDMHFGLLTEIRNDQKQRLRAIKKGE